MALASGGFAARGGAALVKNGGHSGTLAGLLELACPMATADSKDQPAHAAQAPVSGKTSKVKHAVESPEAGRAGPPTAEHGGPKGPEPTRYGDWERGGRCIDF